MRDYISFSEVKVFTSCEAWYQFLYVDKFPSSKPWSLSFYAGTLVDGLLKNRLSQKEEVPGQILSRSNFVGLDPKAKFPQADMDQRISSAVELLARKFQAEQIVPAKPLSGEFNGIPVLAHPDFIRESPGDLFELKVRAKILPFGMMLRDMVQLTLYNRFFKFPPERVHLVECLISQAKKPTTEVIRIQSTSLKDLLGRVKYDFQAEIDILISRLLANREQKTYARTGILTGSCSWCPYSPSCLGEGTDDE